MEEISIEFDSDFPLESITQLSDHCANAAALITTRKTHQIPQFHAAQGHIIWPLLNSIKEQTGLSDSAVFVEWGAGLGLVSMLAAKMNMQSTGVEIESELVEKASYIAAIFGVSVTFQCADIFTMPRSYKEADMFFAYPWPAQKPSIIDLFERTAKPGALLFCYEGGLKYQVLRKRL